jgi:outer membrane protein OmpA-like peptidoglycan-associated protein
MLFRSQSGLHRAFAILPATLTLLCVLGASAAAQDRPVPKWELYGGYSLWYPGADVHGQLPGALLALDSRLELNPRGAGASVTYNFNRWFGLTLDGSSHWGSGETSVGHRIDDAAFSNLSFGPKFTFRGNHFSPFLEALVGDHRLTPDAFHDIDKLGLMVGGGLDVNLSKHFVLRVIRADYVISNYRFGSPTTTQFTNLRGVRLQTGLSFVFGGEPAPAPASAACSAQPTDVYAGEPVQITVNPSNFNPKRTLSYSYTATGGKVNGTGQTANVDTTGLNSGAYTATANVTDGKRARASCAATFNVKQAQAPTISCSPNPATVQPGGSSTISSNAGSPDNRRLTYSYSASSGTISGSDASATLNAGAQPGPITVTCNVADDRTPPLTASATTTVTVEAPPPPPPPPPAASKINQIEFPNLQKPWRVDNTAKAILDDVALRLQREPDSKLVIVGSQEETEHRKNLSAERAVDAKAYLTNEKGIDPSRIETRSGGTAGKVAEFWIVPAGASYSGSEVTVDENLVKAIPDHPAARRGVKK